MEIEYDEFPDEVSFEDFTFSKYYLDEDRVLRPQLEALGYYAIEFSMGERDSFGPLTRICTCLNSKGVKCYFIYG